jgi:hypothetical protein
VSRHAWGFGMQSGIYFHVSQTIRTTASRK